MTEARPSCQDLMRGLSSAVLGLSAEGLVNQMNPAAGRLLGVEPEQAAGRAFDQVFADRLAKHEELFQTISAAQAKGSSLNGLVLPLAAPDGSQLEVALTTSPLAGGGLGVVLIDVSQEARRREARRREQSQKDKLLLALTQEKNNLERYLRGHARIRLIAALAIILIFAGAGYYVWTRTHLVSYVEYHLGDQAAAGKQQSVYTVQPQPLESSISLAGSIQPYDTINLLSPFAGRVLERHFTYGQKVAKGALLLKLDTSDLEVKLRDARVAAIKAQESYQKLLDWKNSDTVLQAQRQLEKSKNDLEVTQQKLSESEMLYKQGIIPLDEFRSIKEQAKNQRISLETLKDQLKAAVDKGNKEKLLVARLERDNAQDKLRKLLRQIKQSRIVAPVVGVVIKPVAAQGAKDSKVVEVGYEVAKGQVLLAIGDLEKLSVSTKVGELNVAKLRPKQKVVITSYAFPGLEIKGHIDTVSSQASTSSDGSPPSFTVGVTTEKLPPEAQAKLRLGMSAELKVQVFYKPKALVVPINAVHPGPTGGNMVTLVLPGGGHKEVKVQTGMTTPEAVEITSGLKAGDKVLLPSGGGGG